jgi:hypothetical protein
LLAIDGRALLRAVRSELTRPSNSGVIINIEVGIQSNTMIFHVPRNLLADEPWFRNAVKAVSTSGWEKNAIEPPTTIPLYLRLT